MPNRQHDVARRRTRVYGVQRALMFGVYECMPSHVCASERRYAQRNYDVRIGI